MPKHHKIVLAFDLIFSLAAYHSASAARLVPGNLPQTDPLQPLPQDVQPNYKESIGSNQPDGGRQNQNEEGQQDSEDGNVSAQNEETGRTITSTDKAANETSKSSIFWIIVIIAGGLIGWLFGCQK